MKKFMLVALSSLLTLSTAYSAPVDIPSSLKNVQDDANEAEERPFHFSVSGEAEGLFGRELRIAGSEVGKNKFKGQFYSGKGTLNVDFLGKWDYYGFAGIGDGLKLEDASINGTELDLKFDQNAFQWGGGVNYLIYTFPEYFGLGVFADAKYRQIDNMDYDSIQVNGADTAFTSNRDPRWQEWQVALGFAGKINYIVPFAGATYSDTRAKANFTANSVTYDINDTRNDMRFGAFAGVSLMPNDYLSIDVQGRFIDEEAVSAKVNFKF